MIITMTICQKTKINNLKNEILFYYLNIKIII